MEEQVAEKDIRKRLAEKEHLLETVKDQLEVARKESTRLRGDLVSQIIDFWNWQTPARMLSGRD